MAVKTHARKAAGEMDTGMYGAYWRALTKGKRLRGKRTTESEHRAMPHTQTDVHPGVTMCKDETLCSSGPVVLLHA